ncbi:hypothetical protein BDN70DRAFT_926025 [Pholiota conissans]|uniref:Heterokaryon incompatibility domain-containing protein n=1 Tax=Pholiota conissans TaxID=109636 RepID=A0A9P5YMM8_9AGAR|nr:hypothetical protein BDN70DRAFT_926025 [Pholiota conissans]
MRPCSTPISLNVALTLLLLPIFLTTTNSKKGSIFAHAPRPVQTVLRVTFEDHVREEGGGMWGLWGVTLMREKIGVEGLGFEVVVGCWRNGISLSPTFKDDVNWGRLAAEMVFWCWGEGERCSTELSVSWFTEVTLAVIVNIAHLRNTHKWDQTYTPWTLDSTLFAHEYFEEHSITVRERRRDYDYWSRKGSQKAHKAEKTDRRSDSIDSTGEGESDAPLKGSAKIMSDAKTQILLDSLRNMILPLIRNVVPTANDKACGPEAELFLVALQNYIVSIVHPQTAQNPVAGLSEKVINLKELDSPQVHLKKDEVGRENALKAVEVTESNIVIPRHINDERSNLHERVFNRLPIRLLYFKKQDDSNILKISLLNQSEVYSTLTEALTRRYMRMPWDDLGRFWLIRSVTEYAILSHTWLRSQSGEITYDLWRKRDFDLLHPGYRKLVQFSKAALENHRMSLGWMDTVCIDKSSSSELDESIRSMYKWYQNSSVCITYLAESSSVSDMVNDSWFTRGWTLQELLAPQTLKFYDCNWNRLTSSSNDKRHKGVQEQIKLATSITKYELTEDYMHNHPISRRMQWAAKRHVTRGEDTAYSLMGIFNVSISIAYGEGECNAFARLLKEIINTTKNDVLDIFNCAGSFYSPSSVLLPSNPQAYLQRDENLKILPTIPMEPLTLTHQGLRVPVLILPFILANTPQAVCTPKGDFFGTVSVKCAEGVLQSLMTTKVSLILDAATFNPHIPSDLLRYALVVLNCTGNERIINVPEQCFAIAISYCNTEVFMSPLTKKYKEQTSHPITFQIQSKNSAMVPVQLDVYKSDSTRPCAMRYWSCGYEDWKRK